METASFGCGEQWGEHPIKFKMAKILPAIGQIQSDVTLTARDGLIQTFARRVPCRQSAHMQDAFHFVFRPARRAVADHLQNG